jgi:DNA-3-methyladenine glycosylase I
MLEGAQAGLSWITIIRKRESYRRAFDGFDPAKIARYSARRINALLQDPGIVRNRLKVEAAKTNARAFLDLVAETGTFHAYLMSLLGGKPKVNAWKTMREVPASTAESDALSLDLRKRGFRFVGSTICYAFMQAVGLVNDHLVTCPRHAEIRRASR